MKNNKHSQNVKNTLETDSDSSVTVELDCAH